MTVTRRASLLAAALLYSAFVSFAQQTQTTVVPADAKAARQPEPWTKIPIPPLAPFNPEPPKRIQLSNGLVILLEEDHELPFIYGSINMRGGERDVPAAKTGLIGLYGETWRTSGTPTMNGDKLDDLL
jgi:zinc protease